MKRHKIKENAFQAPSFIEIVRFWFDYAHRRYGGSEHIVNGKLLEFCKNLRIVNQVIILCFVLVLRAGELGVDDMVASLDLDGDTQAFIVAPAGTDRDDGTFLGNFLHEVG